MNPKDYLSKIYEELDDDEELLISTEELMIIFEALSTYIVACCFENDQKMLDKAVKTAKKIYYMLTLDEEGELN